MEIKLFTFEIENNYHTFSVLVTIIILYLHPKIPNKFFMDIYFEVLLDSYGLFGSLEREVSRGEESSGEESIKEWLSSTLFGCFLN